MSLTGPDTILPLFYQKLQIPYFLGALALAGLIFCGMLEAWVLLKRVLRLEAECVYAELSESLIIVPLALFPLFFLASQGGYYRHLLVLSQALFLALGTSSLIKEKSRLRFIRETGGFTLPSFLCLFTVALFIYWPFVMPFAESFNGHHHIIINTVQQMWKKGSFSLLPAQEVSYDKVIYVWPANFTFFLSLFSFPYLPAIGEHALFIIPGALSFLTWQLLRYAGKRHWQGAGAGDLAFLLLAFSYTNAFDFSAIHFDTFSPLCCVLFAAITADIFLAQRFSRIPYAILLLSFTFLTRKQLFLLFFHVLSLMLIYCLSRLFITKKIKPFKPGIKGAFLVFVFILPAFFWGTLVYHRYGSPFYPHDSSSTRLIFRPDYSGYSPQLDGPRTPAKDGGERQAPMEWVKEAFSTIKSYGKYDVNYFIENFFPAHLSKGKAVLLKNIFCGLSNSLLLMLGLFGGLLLLALRRRKGAVIFVLLTLAGYLVSWARYFLVYPKYPHYLGYLTAGCAAYFYLFVPAGPRIARFFPPLLACALFGFGMASWGYNSFGHAAKDAGFENIRFLMPSYKTVFDRIGRMASRAAQDIRQEASELEAALAYNHLHTGNILYMDHEPGLLIPSILNAQDFSEAYFLENLRSRDIYLAKDKEELDRAFKKHNITFIYAPGRSHGEFDNTLILRAMRERKRAHAYVVPKKELLE